MPTSTSVFSRYTRVRWVTNTTVIVMKILLSTIMMLPRPCSTPNLSALLRMTTRALAEDWQKLVPDRAVSMKACLLKYLTMAVIQQRMHRRTLIT